MKAKPRVIFAWVAAFLVAGLLVGGCADVDEGYVRDPGMPPIAANSVIVGASVPNKANGSELQYDQTHPVNSFDDFDESFRPTSDAPLSDPFNRGVRGH